jgi:hypothetical protein
LQDGLQAKVRTILARCGSRNRYNTGGEAAQEGSDELKARWIEHQGTAAGFGPLHKPSSQGMHPVLQLPEGQGIGRAVVTQEGERHPVRLVLGMAAKAIEDSRI